MDTFGRHLLAEYYGCDAALLDDPDRIRELLISAARAVDATIVEVVTHQFAPQGVSGVAVIQESHVSIHTWPEHGYVAIDFFTCGDLDPDRAHEVLRKGLRAEGFELIVLHRGALPPRRSLTIARHDRGTLEPPLTSDT